MTAAASASVPDMEYRRLGTTGLAVSVVGLGCNNFGRRIDLEASRAVVEAALHLGVTLFDTADRYGPSEEFLGEILGRRRDDVIIATKFGLALGGDNGADWAARGSRRYVRRAVERSLRVLRTDWIDLYQLHRPDPLTPLEETLSVLTDLVHEGKVRYIGSSGLEAWKVADAHWRARAGGHEPFCSVQNEYSLLERGIEADVVPACLEYGLGVLPYSPLANGMLTGKYRRDESPAEGTRISAWNMAGYLTPERFDAVDRLTHFAAERDLGLLDIAIGGLAAQPAVSSVIAGATSVEQVRANVAAGGWRPSHDDLAALDLAVASCRPDGPEKFPVIPLKR